MRITGIICEYNPFHLGHKYHLECAKKDTECDGIICIMSGNYMQRGIPSIIDKFNRSKMAVLNGVDLVIELPLIHSISSAEGFAKGAISILNNTKVVNNLYFGSESLSLSPLTDIAQTLTSESSNYKIFLKESLDKGLPFHKSRENALKNLNSHIDFESILSSSNNILAIEYLKALISLKSTITPYSLVRKGASYNNNDIEESFPSATAIRKVLNESGDISFLNGSLPSKSFTLLKELHSKNYHFTFPEGMFEFLKYKILTKGDNLSKIPLSSEGLDNKIIKEIINSNSLDELTLKIKSKRYTYTRISRILTSFFIGLEDYNTNSLISSSYEYIRPLAFNEKGTQILKKIKENSNINIITKIPKKITNDSLNFDILGTKSYSVINSSILPNADYTTSPYFQKL